MWELAFPTLGTLFLTMLGTTPWEPLRLQEGKLVSPDGQVVPLAWAYHLTDPREVEEYAGWGFNVAYVDLPFAGTEEELHQLLAETRRWGLRLVLGLATVQGVRERGKVDPEDEEYRREAKSWIQGVVEQFQAIPNLLGWGVQHAPEAVLEFSEPGFRAALAAQYGDLAGLSRAWGIPLRAWEEVQVAGVVTADDGQPARFGLPSLDWARYQHQAFRNVLEFWARCIREVDPDHLLFTGRLERYRSLIGVPAEYAVIVPSVDPVRAEPDRDTHNVHGVDIARRGNRFAAVPTLLSGGGGQAVEEQELGQWTLAAFVHGAAGVAYSDWEALQRNPTRQAGVRRGLDLAWQTGLCLGRSTPTVAVLYEPFGAGDRVQGQVLYGYEAGLVEDEPCGLLAAFKLGMKFGQIDVLGLEDLLQVPLHRYGTLLAPAAFDLPPPAVERLQEFVAEGGVLVADLGIGCYQRKGRVTGLSWELRRLLGIEEIPVITWFEGEPATSAKKGQEVREKAYQEAIQRAGILQQKPGNWRCQEAHPLFPSIAPRAYTSGRREGGAFKGWQAFLVPSPETVRFGRITDYTDPHTGRNWFCGVTIHPYGLGYGVFGSVFLWRDWRPGSLLYEEFHGDVMRNRATLEVVNCDSLFPLPAEFARHEDRLVIYHRGQGRPAAMVRWDDLDRALYPQALNYLTWKIENLPGELGRTPQSRPPSAATYTFTNLLFLQLLPESLLVLSPLPLRLTPQGQNIAAQVVEYGPERIVLNVFGEEAPVRPNFQAGWQVSGGRRTTAILTIDSGLYPIAPGSRHRVEIASQPTQRWVREYLLLADHQGRLTLQTELRRDRITVQPLEATGPFQNPTISSSQREGSDGDIPQTDHGKQSYPLTGQTGMASH